MTTSIRALSGVITGGLVALALAVITIAILGGAPDLSGMNSFPGPGAKSILAHLGAAVVAVIAQVYSDRRRGIAAFGVLILVLGLTALLLWTQWLN
ncbi:MAG: hypothetical protein LLG14_04135 [Nocardiaceae bacterium]|nr:hypothetical protein [Nocardiaceae bacterium]